MESFPNMAAPQPQETTMNQAPHLTAAQFAGLLNRSHTTFTTLRKNGVVPPPSMVIGSSKLWSLKVASRVAAKLRKEAPHA